MPTVLITGANRGLGLEFAKQYAETGWTVIACCRDRGTADELRNLAKAHEGRVKVERLDVHMEYDIWDRIIRTNVFGPMKVSEAFVDNIAAGGHKKIINISSTVGSNAESRDKPAFCYGPSKAALTKVSTLMAEVLRERGISVLALCPGHVKTQLGGLDAKIEIPDSITGMRQVIDGLGLQTSGSYLRYTGETVAF